MGMIILPCGHRSLRFRPPLDITRAEVDEAMTILLKAVDHVLAR
jgi:L-lysine 6-transaminase